MNINNPIPEEWNDYVTQTNIALEVVPDQLYDVKTYVDNTSLELNYFNAVAANKSISNMTQAGILPNPESFLVQAVRIKYNNLVETDDAGAPGALASAMNDIVLLQNTGRFLLTIGHKQYGPWKLWPMPAGSGVMGMMASGGAEAANLVHGYANTFGKLWGVFPHLMIAPLQAFQVDLLWPAAVNLSANIDIEVMFDGQRARAVS